MNTPQLAHQIRKMLINMSMDQPAHIIAASLSIVDIIAVLYGSQMHINPQNPNDVDRDRFILSKGHAALAVYAALIECGFFSQDLVYSIDHQVLKSSINISHHLPGVELSTGSLGHGLPVCAGIAYAAELDKKKYRVFGLLGDGECNSGANWEAALFAGNHKLSNLIIMIDYNKLQRVGTIENILSLEPFAEKWMAFRWRALEVDGHDHIALKETFQKVIFEQNKPTVIICHTIKGKGISFLENKATFPFYHLTEEYYLKAVKEIDDLK